MNLIQNQQLKNQTEVIAYIRVSTLTQDFGSQKIKLIDYAHSHNLQIVEFISVKMSSLKSEQDRKLEILKARLLTTPVLLIVDLSRLGRKTKEILDNIDYLLKKHIRIISIIDHLDLYQGAADFRNNSEIFIYLYAIMANIQRRVISEKSKDGIAAARLRGKVPGRPIGCIPRSKFDPYLAETKEWLQRGMSVSNIIIFLNGKYQVSFPYDSFLKYLKRKGLVIRAKKPLT